MVDGERQAPIDRQIRLLERAADAAFPDPEQRAAVNRPLL